MTFTIGIDGGGSGCRAAVADAAGTVIGRGDGGPANINTDADGAAASILTATATALNGTGIDPSDLTAVLGLAGGMMHGAAARLTELLPFRQTRIVSDAVTAARGALGRDDGIMAAIGTGSVFVVQRDGASRIVGGHGFLMGDEGSGAVLGRALLSSAMQAADGYAPMTPLLQQVLQDHGGIQGIIAFGNTARPVDFAALAPRIVASDDPAAIHVMDHATGQVRHILTALQDGANLPVVFIGGLGPAYAARLDGPWPLAQAKGTSLDGALLMARQEAAGG